jgi:PAS domain S-box-containing protein
MKNEAAVTTIMVIEDDPENRRVLRMMLTGQGYTVRSFPGGQPALESAREDPPDLILLDIRMPGMDGFEVCTHLKAVDALRGIPVLFLSAIEETEGKIRAFEVGGADFITKPFQHDEVLARIRTQLAIRQYQHELEEKTAQLNEQKRLYRRLIENIGDEYVIFSHTPEGIFTYMSPGSKALFKKGPEELVGKNWRDLNPTAECLAEMVSLDENTVTTGIAPPTSLFYYHHPDGTIHTLEAENVPVLDESGRVIMIDGIAKDITKRLQLEMKLKAANENCQDMNIRLEELVQERTAALKESEEKYRRIVTTANEGIITTDENFIVTFANTVIAELLGGTVEDLIGRPVSDFILEADQKKHQMQMQDREAGGKAIYERKIRRLDGGTRWVIISGAPMTDSEDRFMGSVAMATNITGRKKSEIILKNAYREINKLKKQIEAEKIYLQEEIKLQYNYDEIVGESKEIKYALFRVEQVAATESAVIIFGETGTGKELLARAIHNAGARATKPLIKLNCATLPEQFIESELFGHEIGAFTGAVKTRQGRFELAHSSTLFLDEIGELPLPMQAKLLRVLQDGEFERLGDSQIRKSDARIIAATNRDLDEMVQDGKFRQDLWYRLNVFPITVPPLRDRKDDVPMLINHFINKFAKMTGKKINQIPKKIMDELIAYDWPGNIRELEHVIERAMIISDGDRFQLAEQLAAMPSGSESEKLKPLASIEREHILNALEKTNWVIHGPKGAAGILALHPNTLRSRMQKLAIHRPEK